MVLEGLLGEGPLTGRLEGEVELGTGAWEGWRPALSQLQTPSGDSCLQLPRRSWWLKAWAR